MPAQPDAQLSNVARIVRDRRSQAPSSDGTYVIAIDGAVSVGKSTTAALLANLLGAPPDALSTAVVSTDGFLLPNRVLDDRGLTMRKGFPESYDHDAFAAFVTSVRGGAVELRFPVYSHELYDVLEELQSLDRSDVLVLEGVHALRLAGPVDLAIYVDAAEPDIVRWYTERFLELRASGSGFYARFASMPVDAVVAFAHQVWDEINGPNLHEHILPNRDLADVIIEKGPDHAVRRVTLRE